MRHLKFVRLAVLLSLVLAAAIVPVISSEVTAEEVQAGIDAADQAWTELSAEIGAATLERADSRMIATYMTRGQRDLEKAQRRLDRGDLDEAVEDADEAVSMIAKARKRLEAAGSAGVK